MTPITLPIEVQLSPKSQALLAFLKTLDTDSAPQPTIDPGFKTVELIPAVGQPWPSKGGIYAGVARGLDGEPEGHLVLLDALPDGDLKWAAAIQWAESLGDGARLPTRFESALLYANLQDKIDTERVHWTGSQYSADVAWCQGFYYGGQGDSYKDAELPCRAVRRFPLSTSVL